MELAAINDFSEIRTGLALGNTCVIKPPSVNSLTTLKLAEIIEKLEIPPGTVNVVTGPGDFVGEALAAHRGADMIAFAGSSETGKQITALASQTVKRLQLELGGKNPVIVLDDADVDTAVNGMAKQQTLTVRYVVRQVDFTSMKMCTTNF